MHLEAGDGWWGFLIVYGFVQEVPLEACPSPYAGSIDSIIKGTL